LCSRLLELCPAGAMQAQRAQLRRTRLPARAAVAGRDPPLIGPVRSMLWNAQSSRPAPSRDLPQPSSRTACQARPGSRRVHRDRCAPSGGRWRERQLVARGGHWRRVRRRGVMLPKAAQIDRLLAIWNSAYLATEAWRRRSDYRQLTREGRTRTPFPEPTRGSGERLGDKRIHPGHLVDLAR